MKKMPQILRAEIAKNGVLPFARFMELALYCPEYGYYEQQKDTVGRRGDFITSVSVGELFGELLACQFAGWLAELQIQNSKFKIVEAGAHDGKLAADILNWLQHHRPELFTNLEYILIEPSALRQEWQRQTLKKFAPSVCWFKDFASLKQIAPAGKISGIIFSNELLDAFPVHRFGWDANNKEWFEWGVAVDGEKFVWTKIKKSMAGSRPPEADLPSAIRHLPSSLWDVLPDGYILETSPAAESWWREAADILANGRLLTVDYGHGADELFSPARTCGTLRAYFRHHVTDDILANAGEQDLTAHVNFPAIQAVGENAGLTTEIFQTQSRFLTQILDAAIKGKMFGKWNASRTRQFQTLTHPEHLGRAFRVLVQSR
jgi:SAM-dependent MidA family methyltransferase